MLRSDLPISLPYCSTQTSKWEDGIDLSDVPGGPNVAAVVNADLVVFDIPFKCKVYEAGIVILTSLAGANPGPIDFRFDVRKTAGSDTGRSDGSAGIGYLYETGASVAGEYVYDLAGQTPYNSRTNVGCSLLEPGMQVVFQTGSTNLTGAGLAGKIKPILLVEYMPEVRANLVNAQETS
jgi:hypothetical protein